MKKKLIDDLVEAALRVAGLAKEWNPDKQFPSAEFESAFNPFAHTYITYAKQPPDAGLEYFSREAAYLFRLGHGFRDIKRNYDPTYKQGAGILDAVRNEFLSQVKIVEDLADAIK